MLALDPKDRISSKEALKHKFFSEIRNNGDEVMK